MFHMDSSLVESLIVFTEGMLDFSILRFFLKLFTTSVSSTHKQFSFLFFTDFLPPKTTKRDPINVDACPDIPSYNFSSFIMGFWESIWLNGVDSWLICFHSSFIKLKIQTSFKT